MQPPLTFGVLVLQDAPWPSILARVQQYEAAGFDGIWVADHFVSPWDPAGPWFEGWSLLAALAVQTRRIRLGPLVSHPILRNPALLARQALTVDHLSQGRLTLGLGAGASGHDARMTGAAWESPAARVARFGEAVAVVDELLRAGASSRTGRYYAIQEAVISPRPLQQPRPPLTIAANGPAMIGIAARYADTWNTEGAFRELYQRDVTPADVARLVGERSALLSERAATLGRDPARIRRSFLAGFAPAPERPWSSVDAFADFAGRYQALGISELILPEPDARETQVFERVVHELLPDLRRQR